VVTARTHASIAAYSTCVPTLVVGYSVKARGIARDLFCNEADYVIDISTLKSDTDLRDGFRVIMEREGEIKDMLVGEMPSYIDKTKALDSLFSPNNAGR
jgi:polysaccharide pyruvyl transferase WcaK-like protein